MKSDIRGVDMSSQRLSIISGPQRPPLLEWTFNDVLREQSRRRPNGVVLYSQQQALQLTYSQLQDRAQRLAASLYSLGVRAGDVVGISLGNRAEYAEVSPQAGGKTSMQREADCVVRSFSHVPS
jgi:long-subunit acyl-CoA synthetase (AMP-forming)